MKNFLCRLLVSVVVFMVLLYIFRNPIVKLVIEKGAQMGAGSHVEVKEVDFDIVKTRFFMSGLKAYYPRNIADSLMTSVDELYLDYESLSYFKNKVITINDLRLRIDELVLVTNASGRSFTPSLPFVNGSSDIKKNAKSDSGQEQNRVKLRVEKIYLKIEKLLTKKISADGSVTVKEYNLNLSYEGENISDPGKLIAGMLSSAAVKAGFAGSLNLSDTSIDLISDTAKSAIDIGAGTVKSAGNLLKGILAKE